jgi:putative heme-binding domain-containing protein
MNPPRLPATTSCLLAASLALLAGPLAAQNAQKAKQAATGETPGQKDRRAMAEVANATPASELTLAPGFKAELLYTVPKNDQGSWVALTVDHKGRLLAGDQYGGVYRLTPPAPGSTGPTRVEPLAITLPDVPAPPGVTRPTPKRAEATGGATSPSVGAHGLLYAHDSLYIMVDEVPAKQGLWRLRDTDGDDRFDEVKFLRAMNGSGEHGPHSLALSPDGKFIYFTNGNFTDLPKNLEKTRMVAWGEDHLLPRMWDARGHARNRLAPGGYIGRCDPEGKTFELFSIGFRNAFDIAFDPNGELVTYDSDMEWDQGTPWYMPTRINHAVSGGDFGWRSGAGRWPAYYADSLAEVVNIGPGSPTGTAFGTGAKFPARYQHAFFAADWTFGTLYAIHLKPHGATFRGEKEEFVAGKPLPLTDLVVNPLDGALYFAVGGRRTQSALYRVTYTGSDSTAPAQPAAPSEAAQLRRKLEALHTAGTGPEAIDIAWPHLSSSDRYLRFAARVAIERQPADKWADRALTELQPQALLESLVALARVGDKSLQPKLLAALARLDLDTFLGPNPPIPASTSPEPALQLLRAWQLAFTRMGRPPSETAANLAAALDKHFPHRDPLVNRELVSLLVYLGSPTVVAKTVPLLKVAEPQTITFEELGGAAVIARNDRYGSTVAQVSAGRADRQQIAYAYALRNAKVGWTPELKREFFGWFPRTAPWRGGASFTGFIKNIRSEAIANFVTDPAERARLEAEASSLLAAGPAATALTQMPKGPGRAYTVRDALPAVDGKLTGRNFVQGKAMFAATACTACHRFNNEGLGIGPDLSGAGNRYSVKDLLENIIEPSLVISDQYGSDEIAKKDGTTVVGRVVAEENNALLVMTNPFVPDDHTRIPATDVAGRKPYPVSMMPPGLINSLNEDELRDLVAYILSGGNPDSPMFRK